MPDNARYTKFIASFGKPKFILRLNLEYEDGTLSAIGSDPSWKTASGPITFSNIYGGEDFDASKEPAGWDKQNFADAAWSQAAVVSGPAPALVARSAPPVKVQQSFVPQNIGEPRPGVFVYDLGQNFSGWPAIEVTGEAGKTVKLTPGELLSNGLVTQAAVGSPVYFSYTLKGGGGLEKWHPRFSYTGFRYVQVEGAVPAARAADFPDRPKLSALQGQFVYTSASAVGKFASSDNELNRIHQLILQAFRSNLQTVMTDCPQREKLGWLEQSHLLAPSLMYDFDLATFWEKIVTDMADAQLASGLIPNIAPEFTSIGNADFRNSPEWGSAFLIAPWWVHQFYGEHAAFDAHYARMKRYEAYLSGQASNNLLRYGLGDWYDVGSGNPGRSKLTSAGVTATAIWIQDLQILQQAAELLGHAADATQYKATLGKVTDAFNAEFLKGGRYDRNSQTANAMPLALDIVPEAERSAVRNSLVASVSSVQNRVTAGDIGFAYLLRALSRAGRGDVIFAMLKQSSGPGYLDQIRKGATALTEAWDANPGSSQNHAMLGHAEEWLYNGLGGINPDPAGAGFEKFVIRPQPQAGLTSVETEYRSIRGLIKSSWSNSASEFKLQVTVPVNSIATVYVPTNMPASVTEGGVPAASARGVLSHTEQAGVLMLVLGSGDYSFTAKNGPN